MTDNLLKVAFVDFWPNFVPNDNYFYHLLSVDFSVVIDNDDPDILISSCFGSGKLRYGGHRCRKVFYSGENKGLDCVVDGRWSSVGFANDLTLTFSPTGGNNVYFPLWVQFINWFNVPYSRNRDISYLLDLKLLTEPRCGFNRDSRPHFCSFIASNFNAKIRNEFCSMLSSRKTVTCPGNVHNNYGHIGGRGDQTEKIDFLKLCRFNVAFENSFFDGYVTEKIIQPLYCGCIPIYNGGTVADKYFNKQSVVWAYGEPENVIDQVLNIDRDDELIDSMVRAPVLTDYALNEFNFNRMLKIVIGV